MNYYHDIADGKILVTGGLGAIGTMLIKTLVDSGRNVINYDWKTNNDTLPPNQRIKIVCADIRDKRKLKKLFLKENITGVVHLAAISQVGLSEKNYSLCTKINAGGTWNLMKAIEESGTTPWIVNCSSREVYGEAENIPVSELCRVHPINKYGTSKVMAEKIVSYYTYALGLNAISLRPSNVYGSINDLPERVIPKFIFNAMVGMPIEVYGGGQILDLLHISDAIDGILKAISMLEQMTDNGYYDVFNLASGTPHTLQDVISLVSQYTGKDINTIYLESRSFDVQRYVGDTKKARQKLGFKARVTLEEGVKATVNQYSRNLNKNHTLEPLNENIVLNGVAN